MPTVKLLLPTFPAVIEPAQAAGSPASAGPSVVLASASVLGMLSTSDPPVSGTVTIHAIARMMRIMLRSLREI